MGEDGGSFDKKTQGLPVDTEQHPHGHPGPADQQRHQLLARQRHAAQRQGGVKQLGLTGYGMTLDVDQCLLRGRIRQW